MSSPFVSRSAQLADADASWDRNGLERLSRERCLVLLRTARIGRLGYGMDGVPAVVPVNIATDAAAVVFRLSTGRALAAIEARQLVVVEVDEVNLDACCGWSINVIGVAAEVPAALVDGLSDVPTTWARGDHGRVFRLPLTVVEGRRLAS
ncbi:MAG: pyridoxamine 5'-phosphate oxidase family protein [Actinobacteria bacterium]|nr:pyridoxamine 5'-phosphate oxidase family protein [Actinomycetota bacterium]